jgi:hypothetical protein
MDLFFEFDWTLMLNELKNYCGKHFQGDWKCEDSTIFIRCFWFDWTTVWGISANGEEQEVVCVNDSFLAERLALTLNGGDLGWMFSRSILAPWENRTKN